MTTLSVNGQQRTLELDPATPLLWTLRNLVKAAGGE